MFYGTKKWIVLHSVGLLLLGIGWPSSTAGMVFSTTVVVSSFGRTRRNVSTWDSSQVDWMGNFLSQRKLILKHTTQIIEMFANQTWSSWRSFSSSTEFFVIMQLRLTKNSELPWKAPLHLKKFIMTWFGRGEGKVCPDAKNNFNQK